MAYIPSTASISCIDEYEFSENPGSVTFYDTVDSALKEWVSEIPQKSLYILNNSLISNSNGTTRSLTIIPKPRKCCHGVADSTDASPISICQLATSSSHCFVVDSSSHLWSFPSDDVTSDRVEAVPIQILGERRRIVKVAAGRSHFVLLVEKSDESDDSVVFRDDNDVIDKRGSDCEKCSDDRRLRLSTLMLEADQEASKKKVVPLSSTDEMGELTSDGHSVRLRASTTSTSSAPSKPRHSSLRRVVPSSSESSRELGTKSLEITKSLTMEQLCANTGKSKSLNNPNEMDFSFVSMDRVSIREKLAEEVSQSSICTSSGNSRKPDNSNATDIPQSFEVWSWGQNEFGQLGQGDDISRKSPCHLTELDDLFITEIVCGDEFTAALTGNGEVYVWGRNICVPGESNCIKRPRLLKLGLDQFAFSISSSSSALWILLNSRETSTVLYRCGTNNGSPGVTKVPMVNKDQLPLKLRASATSVRLLKASPNPQLKRLLSMFFETCRMTRLIKALRDIIPVLESCPTAEMADLIENLSTSCSCLFNVFCSSLSLISSLFPCFTSDDALLLRVYSVFFGQPFVGCLDDVIVTYSEYEAYGGHNYQKASESIISRLALEYGAEASKTVAKLAGLFSKIASWSSYLSSQASETSSTAQDNVLSELRSMIVCWNSQDGLHRRKLQMAAMTRKAWKNTRLPFRRRGRLLIGCFDLRDSEVAIRKLLSPTKPTVTIFSDLLVLEERGGYLWHTRSCPLRLVWAERVESGRIRILTPEMDTELDLVDDENSFLLKCGYWFDERQEGRRVPQRRTAEFEFSSDCPTDRLRGGAYSGEWRRGRLSGRGTLNLSNGDVQRGMFHDDQIHGMGEWLRSSADADTSFMSSTFYYPKTSKTERFDVFRGIFTKGKLNGIAQIRYADDTSYDGYVRDGLPCGFGVRKTKHLIHIGEFRDGKAHGYGVAASNKQKWLGEFADSQLSGRGIVVTIDGSLHEGEWVAGNVKRGRVISAPSDGSQSLEYEGEMTGWGEIGKKGRLRVSPQMVLEGSFSGNILSGRVEVVAAVLMAETSILSPVHSMLISNGPFLGEWSVPMDRRWQSMFDVFRTEELGCDPESVVDSQKVWSSIVSGMSRGRQLVAGDVRQGFCDALERIPDYHNPWTAEYYAMVAEYWRLSLDNSFHPLRRLLFGCVEVFSTSYSDISAHRGLYAQAVLEAIHLVRKTYEIVRVIFPSLPNDCHEVVPQSDEQSLVETSPESSPEKTCPRREQTGAIQVPLPASDFIYESFFSRCSPVLFTIYSLYNSERDDKYWARAVYLNAHTDVKLLTHLDVRKDLWPIEFKSDHTRDLDKPLIVTTARDRFYRRAVDGLQRLPGETNPATKLRLLADTFGIMKACVDEQTEVGRKHRWSTDDLLPAFIYVVIRSQIRHLGSEILLLDDFSRSYRGEGEIGMMFTMLQSSYLHICSEKSLV